MEKAERRVILPAAFILDLDDVMWHQGADLRYIGQASRSEFPRHHVPGDYDIIHYLGQALNMKIICQTDFQPVNDGPHHMIETGMMTES